MKMVENVASAGQCLLVPLQSLRGAVFYECRASALVQAHCLTLDIFVVVTTEVTLLMPNCYLYVTLFYCSSPLRAVLHAGVAARLLERQYIGGVVYTHE